MIDGTLAFQVLLLPTMIDLDLTTHLCTLERTHKARLVQRQHRASSTDAADSTTWL